MYFYKSLFSNLRINNTHSSDIKLIINIWLTLTKSIVHFYDSVCKDKGQFLCIIQVVYINLIKIYLF